MPTHILRGHACDITFLKFSASGHSLYTGDAHGFVGVWSTQRWRARMFWRAHSEGILAIAETEDGAILTHGRDHCIKTFRLPPHISTIGHVPIASAPSVFRTDALDAVAVLPVSTVSFCKMSVCGSLVAVPAVMHDDKIDIFRLNSSPPRVYKDIGTSLAKTGAVTCICLTNEFLVAGYESGHLVKYSVRPETRSWTTVFAQRVHRDIVTDLKVLGGDIWSVGADHRIAITSLETGTAQYIDTLSPGRGGIALESNHGLAATANWNSNVDIFSTSSRTLLHTLHAHRSGVHVVDFLCKPTGLKKHSLLKHYESESDSESDSDDDNDGVYVAAGGNEPHVSVWMV